MAIYKAIPLDMIVAPNYWAPLDDNQWEIVDPNAVTLWFQLQISDSLGDRPYVAAVGASLSLTFQRSDKFASDAGRLTQTAQGVTVVASANADSRSLFSLSLTTTQIQSIISGSVKFVLSEGAQTNTWIQNYLLSKKLTNPGF